MHKRKLHRYLCAVLLLLCAAAALPSAALGAEAGAAVEISEEERDWIAEKGVLTIGCPVGNCPVLFQDKDTGEVKGITVDILNMVSEATGLTFQYQALPSGNITYDILRQLQVDMVASVEYNGINAQSVGIAMTEPYLQAEKVFVCRKGDIFNPDEEMVVAVASGSQTLAKVIREQYPRFRVDFYDSIEQALSALLSGDADAVLQNQYSLERILAKPLYDDLRIVAAASIGDQQCLACLLPIGEGRQTIRTEEAELLLSILNKGIAGLDNNEVSFAIIKGMVENAYRLSLGDMLYRYRFTVLAVLVSAAVILALLWRNYVLGKGRSEQLAAEQKARELAAINGHMHEQQILLMDALERAKEGNRAKSTFLFNMSHDIRTPMNAILGFTAIACSHKDDKDKLSDCLEKIQESGNHLLRLIDDILDMSRIESGKVVLTEDPCNLVESIDKVKGILQTEMDKRELAVRTDVVDVTDEWVYCDSLRLNQILFNLLSNAAKFSKPGGEVAIVLEQEPSSMGDYAAYTLHVRDTGIGMSQEFQARIFEPFERERTSTVSRTQGTGLGMSITKNLVELMGGTIEVHSQLDQGTEFILRFTFKIQEEGQRYEKKPAKPEVDFSGRRLLLVEDNALNQEIAQEILSEEGFLVETADDGREAVEMVKSSAPGYYDAILMDIQMPVMNGYQAAREIRRLETKALAHIPIIALTANAFQEDKKQALASGMDGHISKPVSIEILRDTLGKFIR